MQSAKDILAKPRRRTPQGYVTLHFAVRKRLGLSILDYALLALIYSLARKRGECFASRRFLARQLGVSGRTVQRGLGRLRAKGLVLGSTRLRVPSSAEVALSQKCG